ncbi:rhomboid family intramembrane serine protease [Gloeobacter morelensis]|uniref:Rhomboid family intramembrane serine protease n=1 Tax=Gloeobacter morelensis MG652769 TaxID=2781736 RepID=A0ABY3PPS4_9CYAN|nr:rhomboid family intramembrane serine protease [Gloeobacter morelensis]UFP95614.1 rhomboid family intramembrane serine protease [Gloeobacter morelensis MG652769]
MLKKSENQSIARTIKSQAQILGGTVAAFWGIEIVDQVLFAGRYLDLFGIHPRDLDSLINIFFAPFLHVGFGHLIANTVPFVVLGWLIMARNFKDFFWVTLIVTLVSGLGVWLFAPANTVHLGASGVVFGYLGYLLLRGYFERSWQSVLIALGVGFLFGGALWGVLPLQAGVSWQAHLFGFLGGVLAARWLTPRRPAA